MGYNVFYHCIYDAASFTAAGACMALRALSIHAHFYQPPREDPITGIVPQELGAHPYPNWNARIHAECYRPNAELRNFEQISFNIGPTLSIWMQNHDPETVRRIVEQDRTNLQRYGVGNAMAQAYNHTILPLSPTHDKITQITWGIADFKYRFGRRPLGMWLPETAVDLETLEVLSRHGIQFTILAPWQADTSAIDTSQPYTVTLSKHHQVTVFFYHPDLSAQISFQPQVTTNADLFAQNILQTRFDPEKSRRGEAQLILVASDGELYGHHQPLRDQFLARLVDGASNSVGISSTYPARWLKSHPPRQTIGIRECTSWSCHHGVSRWNGQCTCTPGDGTWKTKLRYAFERLSVELDHLYLDATRHLICDPWTLRNLYIHVLLGKLSADTLINQTSIRSLTSQQVRQIRLLLEAQHERQRMFTSCGWFFEDFDRIEPKNNVAYAAQAVHLAHQATGVDLSPSILSELNQVISQRSGIRASATFQYNLQRARNFRPHHSD
jgi:alpha-amylase/alpha-mannosidase (GH57 family)